VPYLLKFTWFLRAEYQIDALINVIVFKLWPWPSMVFQNSACGYYGVSCEYIEGFRMTKVLNSIVYGGPQSGSPLLIVHGLFGSARNWGVLAKRLSEDRHVVSVDMRNHGASFHSANNSYADLATDLAAVIEVNGGKVDVLGHSMGGKAAMVLALMRPELVGRMIVADIAPVGYLYSPSKEIAAMKAVDLSVVERRRDADVQLEEWISDAPLRAFLLQSLILGDDGATWKFNLDALDVAMRELRGFPEFQTVNTGETLFLSGAKSEYVLPIYHEKIVARFPNSKFEVIEGAGHWLHAEKPREFEAAVRGFLE